MMFVEEFSQYPVHAGVSGDDEVLSWSKARVVFQDGVITVYDANVSPPYVFRRVFSAEAEGTAERLGNAFRVQTVDGVTVDVSAPQGCGCGDKGKKFMYPERSPEILVPE